LFKLMKSGQSSTPGCRSGQVFRGAAHADRRFGRNALVGDERIELPTGPV
jgi:hypothetical protein